MQVTLHSAFHWDCEECGRENFERGISGVLHMTPLLAKMLIDQHLLLQPEAVELTDESAVAHMHYRAQRVVLGPPDVVCKFCNAAFSAKIENLEVPEPQDLGNLDPAFADAALDAENLDPSLDEEYEAAGHDLSTDEIIDDAISSRELEALGGLQGGPYDWMLQSLDNEDDLEDDD